MNGSRQFGDVFCLWSFGARNDCEFHFVAFVQRTIAVHRDCGIVDENVLFFAAIMRDETIALGGVEPLDSAGNAIIHTTNHLLSF